MFNFNRKIKYQANLYTNILIIVGILIVVNILASFFFHRFDLTQNKNYSLSSSSKDILKSLDDLVTVKVYFSKDLPPNLVNLRQDVSDVLDEYKNYGKNNLKIEYVDPQANQKTEQAVLALGIPKLQFNVYQKEKLQVVSGYLGVVLFYGNKKEIIPEVVDTKNLEYDLTSLIKKLTEVKENKIALASGNDELNPTQDITFLNQFLGQQYDVSQFDLSQNKTISPDIKTLILIGPTKIFTDKEKFILDQFLMGGGSILLAYNGVSVDQNLQTGKNDLGLADQFENYGIKLNSDLVLDESSEIASFNTDSGPFLIQYPFWIKMTKAGLDQNSVVTNKLQSLVLPWTSSLETIKDKAGGNEIQELAKTTNKSWVVSDNYNLNPQQQFNPTNQKPYLVAAAVFGKFNSFFAGKPLPEGMTGQAVEKTDNARLAVIGNAQFIRDGFVQQFKDNLIFFLNIVDNLTLSQDLISIRAKAISSYPLKNLSDSQRLTFKFFGIFSSIIIVALLGLVKYISRKRKMFKPDV